MAKAQPTSIAMSNDFDRQAKQDRYDAEQHCRET